MTIALELANFGRGPALKCFYCARIDIAQPPQCLWYPSAIRDFAPTTALQSLNAGVRTDEVRGAIILDGLLPGEKGYAEATVCIDQFGMRYRFRTDRENPDLWKPGQPTIGWEKWFPMPGEDC